MDVHREKKGRRLWFLFFFFPGWKRASLVWVRSFRYLKRLKQLQRRHSVLSGWVYFNISKVFFFFFPLRKEIHSLEERKHSEIFYSEWFLIVFKETPQHFKHAEGGKCPHFRLPVLIAACYQFAIWWLCKSKFSVNRLIFFWETSREKCMDTMVFICPLKVPTCVWKCHGQAGCRQPSCQQFQPFSHKEHCLNVA